MNPLTWPDGTPRSNGNAFTWQGRASVFTTDKKLAHALRSTAAMAGASEKFGPITTYVKAKKETKK